MNKRLEKRHKRQVSRARERVKQSEPDLRTPEQVAAAREVSGAVAAQRAHQRPLYSTPSSKHPAPEPGAPAKDDVPS
jgi:hypothetical protein